MADYADITALITGYLPSVTSDEDKAALAGMITRASRALDTRTRRQANAFVPAPTEASELIFYGADSAVLLTSDFVAGSVATVICPTGYLPEGWREFRRREVSTGTTRIGLHTSTVDGILTPRALWKKGVPFTVTARWGFAATPAEITEACLQLVREWWRQQSGEVAGPIGDMQQFRRQERGFPKAVDELIQPYVLEDAVEDSEAGTIERGELLNDDLIPWRDPHGGREPF